MIQHAHSKEYNTVRYNLHATPLWQWSSRAILFHLFPPYTHPSLRSPRWTTVAHINPREYFNLHPPKIEINTDFQFNQIFPHVFLRTTFSHLNNESHFLTSSNTQSVLKLLLDNGGCFTYLLVYNWLIWSLISKLSLFFLPIVLIVEETMIFTLKTIFMLDFALCRLQLECVL